MQPEYFIYFYSFGPEYLCTANQNTVGIIRKYSGRNVGVGRVYLKMYIKIREEGTSLKNVVLSKLFNTPRPPPANYLYIYDLFGSASMQTSRKCIGEV